MTSLQPGTWMTGGTPLTLTLDMTSLTADTNHTIADTTRHTITVTTCHLRRKQSLMTLRSQRHIHQQELLSARHTIVHTAPEPTLPSFEPQFLHTDEVARSE